MGVRARRCVLSPSIVLAVEKLSTRLVRQRCGYHLPPRPMTRVRCLFFLSALHLLVPRVLLTGPVERGIVLVSTDQALGDAPPPTPHARPEPEQPAATTAGGKEDTGEDTTNKTATQKVPTKPGGAQRWLARSALCCTLHCASSTLVLT